MYGTKNSRCDLWPGYSLLLVVIGMQDWSCPGQEKSKSPIIWDVPDNLGLLATLGVIETAGSGSAVKGLWDVKTEILLFLADHRCFLQEGD